MARRSSARAGRRLTAKPLIVIGIPHSRTRRFTFPWFACQQINVKNMIPAIKVLPCLRGDFMRLRLLVLSFLVLMLQGCGQPAAENGPANSDPKGKGQPVPGQSTFNGEPL